MERQRSDIKAGPDDLAGLSAKDREALSRLEAIIRDLGSVAVAFSGGADSSFLLAAAHRVLSDRAMAITAVSPTYPDEELRCAKEFAEERGIRHQVIESNELEIEGFSQNPVDRCYYCKSELFAKCREVARSAGVEHVADATNTDDLCDHRPGMKAGDEQGVKRPLLEAGFDKEMIRRVSRALDLPTWNKPQLACLSSRFPYGTEITKERLEKVAAAERALKGLGFKQLRVRYHGEVARIEIAPEEMDRLLDPEMRSEVHDRVKAAGFTYVSLDLKGYRPGSMNE